MRATTTPEEHIMSGWEILAALLAAGLLIYLIAVLLRPEDFS
jgi:K+-transporting ATPase KdpF subunit